MNARTILVVAATFAVTCVACGGPKPPDARYPARAEGCDVKLFHDSPTVQTDNLGPVMANCSQSVSEADCVRQLQDEACKLGGDVVWGVPDKPTLDGGKNLWFGRAAHTKIGGPATAAASAPTAPPAPAP